MKATTNAINGVYTGYPKPFIRFTYAFTPSLTAAEQQRWIDWAIWMCGKFQRTSSAVEGRNGYLSRLHQANRGFTEQTLQVLTIIHNFDLKRDDGTAAAHRLFE